MEKNSMKEYEMPLHMQLAMRKAELAAQEMTWDQLQVVVLNLFGRRLMELQAIKDLLASEGLDVEFNIPSDIELQELAIARLMLEEGIDEIEDGEEPPSIFA